MDIDYVLTRGVEQILPNKDDLKKLMTERKIKLYQGFDPTAKSLHIGNFIGARKLAQFQKLGHQVIFLVGDGTGQAGDPSGRDSAREKFFDNQELLSNSEGWKSQLSNILDFEGDNPVQMLYNSSWLNTLNLPEILKISENFTVQQIIERDMYKKRLEKGDPINLREFVYPLLQGYDSVHMEVDLEIGGNDQLFNMMAGRTLLKNMKNKDKFVLTMKLITDSNGVKMGKSSGNGVNLDQSAENIYGAIMAFPDDMLVSAYELLTDLEYKQSDNPMSDKKALAFDIVRQIKGEEDARKAETHFENTFQNSKPEYSEKVEYTENFVSTIAKAMNTSNSEAKRLIFQNAVSVNEERVTDINFEIKKGDKLKIGAKKFVEVV